MVEGGEIGPRTELAVAVNGRIRALTRCFQEGWPAAIPCARARVGFQGGYNRSRHLRGRGRRSNTEIGLARSESRSTLIVRVVP